MALFDAEAASIALHDPVTDRLVIRVAAGMAGEGAVGLAFSSDEGIAGYVFTTGQPLAVSDVASDPRFDRAVAERTGYVPRSILAVPLLDDSGSIGVLEVLDRHGDQGFGLRDLDLASVFARQAAVAIRASRVERDVTELLRLTLATARGRPRGDPAALDAAVAEITRRPGRRRGCAPVGPGRRRRAGTAGGPGPGRARRRDPRCARPSRVAARAAVVPPVTELPAWSEPFAAGHRDILARSGPWGRSDRAWAFGDGSGRGLRVAIVDSGVEGSHPAVGGRLVEAVAVERRGEDWAVVPTQPTDVVGHGTACAGIIHGLAPEAELVSVRVLGPDNRGNGGAFATGLLWAIESSGASVVNLSLSSRSDALFGTFHELADEAYFRNVLLVAAANNVSVASYPSLYAAVVSVAAHDVPDPAAWFYNPAPPVEFGAYGLNVDVAWRGGTRMSVTGNSFAAPHIAGYAARIRAAHPGITPFETKAVLAATADNAR